MFHEDTPKRDENRSIAQESFWKQDPPISQLETGGDTEGALPHGMESTVPLPRYRPERLI